MLPTAFNADTAPQSHLDCSPPSPGIGDRSRYVQCLARQLRLGLLAWCTVVTVAFSSAVHAQPPMAPSAPRQVTAPPASRPIAAKTAVIEATAATPAIAEAALPLPLTALDFGPAEMVPQTIAQSAPPVGKSLTHYWMVSSRHCDESLQTAQACEFQVEYIDATGRHPSRLTDLVSSFPEGSPICVMTHGSFVDLELANTDAEGTYRWLSATAPTDGPPLQLIFFTWPSHSNRFDYLQQGWRAHRHGIYLADFVCQLPVGHPVIMLGHSHGGRATASAVHELGGGCVDGIALRPGRDPGNPITMILASAAFDHNWLNPGRLYDKAIRRAELLVNLRNRHDFPLVFYPLSRPGAPRAIAVAGLTRSDRTRLGSYAQRIREYDLTDCLGHGHTWPYYYRQPHLAMLLQPYLYHRDPSTTPILPSGAQPSGASLETTTAPAAAPTTGSASATRSPSAGGTAPTMAGSPDAKPSIPPPPAPAATRPVRPPSATAIHRTPTPLSR